MRIKKLLIVISLLTACVMSAGAECGGYYYTNDNGCYVWNESGDGCTYYCDYGNGCTYYYDNGCTYYCYDYDCSNPTQAPEAGCPATEEPTAEPTTEPTVEPTVVPTAEPTAEPTAVPTAEATAKPTQRPTAKPTEAPSQDGQNSSSLASQVIAQVNAERAKNGLGALSADSDLTSAACVRAKEIVSTFSHTRPDGSSWSTVSGKAYGENIAKGYSTADKVMAAWLTSEGHRANIMRESFTTIGVCAYEVNGVVYWVQLFGTN